MLPMSGGHKATSEGSALYEEQLPKSSSAGDGPRKRRKISQACDQCRTRKSRCDGQKPVCGECLQRVSQKSPCRYRSTVNRDQTHDDYVTSLLERIHELESKQNVDSAATVPMSPTSSQSPAGFTEVLSAVGVNPQTAHDQVSPVDAMGSNLACDPTSNEVGDRFYGSSSTVSFLGEVYTAIGGGNGAQHSVALAIPRSSGVDNDQSWSASSLARFSLPPRQATDQMLDLYWCNVHHLYPFIHRPTFEAAYERLWLPADSNQEPVLCNNEILGSKKSGPNSVVFHCALNVMFALASQFLDLPLEERTNLGDLFGERSRKLCHLDLFDEGSLAFIQTLLLVAQHLQSTPYPNRCWNCIGIACRLAQGMGLHVESQNHHERLSSHEIDMRRRVWHGCVMLDAVVSMTLGRPLMLRKSQQIPLPVAVDGDEDLGQVRGAVQHVSRAHFFVESIKLYDILHDVVTQIYQNPEDKAGSSSTTAGFDVIINFDNAISKLEDNLPPHLHPSKRIELGTEIRDSDLFLQQAYVLQARRLHLRLLLYRPVFTRFCQTVCAQLTTQNSPPNHGIRLSEASTGMARALSEACVEHAVQLIQTIYTSISKSVTGAWWYNLFYARTAGVVILLAMTCPSIANSNGGGDRLNKTWDSCQSVLTHLQAFSPRASLCLRQLQGLHRHVQNFRSRQERPHSSVGSQVYSGVDHASQNMHAIPAVPLTNVSKDADNIDRFWTGGGLIDDDILAFDLGQDFDWETFTSSAG